MKINSINNQNQNKSFKGNLIDKTTKFIIDHPKTIAALAGSSVITQKVVMSGSEAVIGPALDVGIGRAITKIAKEEDNRTNESSKKQAVRTFAQSVGGTIIGVGIRAACIGAATVGLSKLGEKTGTKIAQVLTDNNDKLKENAFKYKDKMAAWGKSVGGGAATLIMLVTNFIIDVPFINWINKKTMPIADKLIKTNNNQTKEAK